MRSWDLTGDDLLAPFQHGYDGVLEALELGLSPSNDGVLAKVRLRVCALVSEAYQWTEVRMQFSELEFAHVESAWFVGGGRVLYDGARLLRADKLVLDLDPGTAWLTMSAEHRSSRFLLIGSGDVVFKEAGGLDAN